MSCKHETGPWPGGQQWPACLKCEIEHLRAYQQQMNGILIENDNLRGVRDQLLADHQQYVDWASPQLERLGREMKENERLGAEVQRLQRALNFWLP